jgi:hypothetical protein
LATIGDRQFGQANVTEPGDDVNTDDRLVLLPGRRGETGPNLIEPPLEEYPKPQPTGIGWYLLVPLPCQLAKQRQPFGLRRCGR